MVRSPESAKLEAITELVVDISSGILRDGTLPFSASFRTQNITHLDIQLASLNNGVRVNVCIV